MDYCCLASWEQISTDNLHILLKHTGTFHSRYTPEQLATQRWPSQVERLKKKKKTGNTKAFSDEYQPVMTSGRALNCLEACAVQQAASSHPARADASR